MIPAVLAAVLLVGTVVGALEDLGDGTWRGRRSALLALGVMLTLVALVVGLLGRALLPLDALWSRLT